MPLLALPTELIIQIASYLQRSRSHKRYRDINSLTQTCRDLYIIVNPLLYSLEANLDPRRYSRPRTALHHAAQTGLVGTSQKAFQAGAKPCSKCLYLAITHKQPEMFTILLDAGVWSEKDLLSHLGSAVVAGEAEIVKELLLRGADPSLPLYGHLKPPLLEALVRDHNAVVDVLLADPRTDHNVRFNDRTDIQGTQTALQEAAKKGNAHVVRSLLEKGACARPNVETPMHSAVINRSPEIVQLLLHREDVDPNALFNGKTPLHHAVSADHDGLVKLLLVDKRVDVNLTGLSNGRAPLHDAVILNNDRAVEYLLAAGADAQIMDREGLSPAMLEECSAQARDELVKQYHKEPPQFSDLSDEQRKRPRLSTGLM